MLDTSVLVAAERGTLAFEHLDEARHVRALDLGR